MITEFPKNYLETIENFASKETLSEKEVVEFELALAALQNYLEEEQKEDGKELLALTKDVEDGISVIDMYRDRILRLKDFVVRFFLEKGSLEKGEQDVSEVAKVRASLGLK